jgi:hypothetical protein
MPSADEQKAQTRYWNWCLNGAFRNSRTQLRSTWPMSQPNFPKKEQSSDPHPPCPEICDTISPQITSQQNHALLI